MDKQKGFTLIELLAVIVILAVIAFIATPLIMGTIRKSKKNAFVDSVYGVVKAAENEYAKENMNANGDIPMKSYQFENGQMDLPVKGEKFGGGTLVLYPDGSISYAIYDKGKNWCVTKDFFEPKNQIKEGIENCKMFATDNLVKNGTGEYESNYNFPSFTYHNDSEGKYFTRNGYIHFASSELIPVDVNATYKQTVDMKTSNANATYYFGFDEFDIDKKHIAANQVRYVRNTLTTLKQDLNNGDTKVYFDNISNWNTNVMNVNYPEISKGFIFWNYKDSTGYQYPAETYSRNAWLGLFDLDKIDKVNHVITLREPWNHGTFKKGTQVSQSYSGGYNYGVRGEQKITPEWKTYSNTIHGVEKNETYSYQKFRPGTKYVRIFGYLDHNKLNAVTYMRNITFKKISN